VAVSCFIIELDVFLQLHLNKLFKLIKEERNYTNYLNKAHLLIEMHSILMKLVERMPRVCKAVIKAKGGYFEESQIANIF
jgi:hypothetical protein